jgi:signal transduction histidine kinase
VTVSTKILRTSTFRLAAAYLLVFAVSAGAMLAYVFWNTVGLMERQTQETIQAEVRGLADQYATRGLNGVVDVISERVNEENGTLYLLVNPSGQRVAGNLESMPKPDPGDNVWIDFPITIGKGEGQIRHTARAFAIDLAGDYELLVGRDVEELRAFRNLIQNTLIWAFVPIFVLGLAGGLLISRNFLRRVDAITDTSQSIMAGDLSRRMPISGVDDELDRLSLSLNEMLGQIERLMHGMKEVTSNVAHDLRTPLTRLRARAEAGLRSMNSDDQKLALQQTLAESDKLLQTFNALLSIARADAGQVRDGFETVDISATLQDLAELYEPLVEEGGGTLSCVVDGGLNVHADRQLLSQVFSNLLENAMKYGVHPERSVVDVAITAQKKSGDVVVTISDRGPGIPADQRTHVLERFVRLDESRTKPGNGLGLSLVASVVKLHNGMLTLDDAKPGLKAVITLPLQA